MLRKLLALNLIKKRNWTDLETNTERKKTLFYYPNTDLDLAPISKTPGRISQIEVEFTN